MCHYSLSPLGGAGSPICDLLNVTCVIFRVTELRKKSVELDQEHNCFCKKNR